jgi:hypothetical protein
MGPRNARGFARLQDLQIFGVEFRGNVGRKKIEHSLAHHIGGLGCPRKRQCAALSKM